MKPTSGRRTAAAGTGIAVSTQDAIIVRGKSLVDELIGHLDFTSMVCFHLTGRLPTDGERCVVDAVLVALMEHGLTPSSITARLIYHSSPEAMQSAVSAGLQGAGSAFLGSMEQLAKLLQEGAEVVAVGQLDAATFCAQTLRQLQSSGQPVPGFGHHIHRPDDPRVPRLLAIAREAGCAGRHTDLLMVLSSTLDEHKGHHVTVNATGAVAAVLSDIGFPWWIMRGFALISRCAGLVGHLLEEHERPVARKLWDLADAAVPYDGPRSPTGT